MNLSSESRQLLASLLHVDMDKDDPEALEIRRLWFNCRGNVHESYEYIMDLDHPWIHRAKLTIITEKLKS